MKKYNFIFLALLLLCSLPAMAQLNGSGYYRLRNVGIADDYISIANDKFSYQFLFGSSDDSHFNNSPQVCGGLTNLADHTDGIKPLIVKAAKIFLQNDIHLVKDDNGTDPSTIVYLQRDEGSDYNIIGQGTSLLTLTTGVYEASVRLIFKERYITIKGSSGNYTASIDISAAAMENINMESWKYGLASWGFGSYQKLGTFYFQDNDGTFSIESSNSSNKCKWVIEKADKLFVNPTVEYKGKYYTTMYVPFAYKLAGDVNKAYVVTAINSDGTLEKAEVATSGGMVPAGTPVVLECLSNNVANCYLNLTTEEPLYSTKSNVSGLGKTAGHVESQYAPAASTASNYNGTNLLKGTYFQNEDAPYAYEYNRSGTNQNATLDLHNTTTFSQGAVYVLGVGSSSGRLGFFKNANTVMKANKAWLELPAGSANEAYTLDFDEPTQEGGNDE